MAAGFPPTLAPGSQRAKLVFLDDRLADSALRVHLPMDRRWPALDWVAESGLGAPACRDSHTRLVLLEPLLLCKDQRQDSRLWAARRSCHYRCSYNRLTQPTALVAAAARSLWPTRSANTCAVRSFEQSQTNTTETPLG